ncbi:MAG: glycosyltransferase [Alphaproteobacteria bacterium]|nr:glycosyltransferase [Alphaproteobacteria bacterium]
MPSVSVIIPAYNRRRYIRRAVESVLCSSGGNIEVIVVDDGSTDGTPEVVGAISDRRVRLLRMESNGGTSAARNRGIEEARGDLIGFLDSDDLATAGRFEAQAHRFSSQPELALLGGSVERMDAEGRAIERQIRPFGDTEARWFLLFDNPFTASTVMVRRTDLLRHNLRFDVAIKFVEDYDLWSRLLRHGGKAEIASDVWVRYRVHDGQLTVREAEVSAAAGRVSTRNLGAIGIHYADEPTAVAIRQLFHQFAVVRLAYPGNPSIEVAQWRCLGAFIRIFEQFRRQAGLDEGMLTQIERDLKDRLYAIMLEQMEQPAA